MGRKFNPNTLKVQLKLAVNRLKLVQNKKSNKNKAARREIAQLLEAGKEESARIKVEHIIREDYTVEAYEILELYCDLLLARYGLVTAPGDECDTGIREAVETLIWAAPRAEIKELPIVREQLIRRYGPDFAKAAMSADNEIINPRVRHKLSIMTPEVKLVNLYLSEIAKAHNIEFDPGLELEPIVNLYGTPPPSGPAPGGPGAPGGGTGGPGGPGVSADLRGLFMPGAPGMPAAPGALPASTFLDQPVPQMQPPLQPMPAHQPTAMPMGQPGVGYPGMMQQQPMAPQQPGMMHFSSPEERAQYEQFLAWQQRQAMMPAPAPAPAPVSDSLPAYTPPVAGKPSPQPSPQPSPAPAPATDPAYVSPGALPPGYQLQASGHTPANPANQPPPASASQPSVNEFGLPIAPSGTPTGGAGSGSSGGAGGGAGGDEDVPDFEDLAARFAALKRN
ncbi:uncharacterized protein AMSG_00375 [Thecamonas trahens ATCC 50062]|uniref:IST1 homolog n=1 Tax=Thecamonas trahens ATCC 50062 TaxID=461836 RepID=A0A0L0DBD8_THETB|nr:hypothetical protein AMSG_00375 [Thecamonas trahens ATCC 50062]KNC48598.1 hypothetical protein AMSG_00375 [Thecamonas trahens ATCC 50062]|eukprot:XP_013762654.1 hypothetical protein AMSG_00375 [Thecamonas trahens ATCC 50062]